MKILVPVKRVIDYNVKPRVKMDGSGVDLANVKGILVNIFGGIMKCDIIAEGIIAAAKEISLSVPLVVRLEGTNVELGKKILAESGLPILSANDLADAAQKIVKAVKG
jgi:succinyl-CoA synthetase beta subunit